MSKRTKEKQFVFDLLEMYEKIEDIKKSTGNEELSKHPLATFRGFGDAGCTEENECRHYAERISKDPELFPSLNIRLDKVPPMLKAYKIMLEESRKLSIIDHWSADFALQILNAPSRN